MYQKYYELNSNVPHVFTSVNVPHVFTSVDKISVKSLAHSDFL